MPSRAPAPPARTGAAHATIDPYGPFSAGDVKTVMLGLQNEREWTIFCEKVLERKDVAAAQDFSTNSRRVAARNDLEAIIIEVFSRFTAEQVIEKLNHANIANARINNMCDVWAHPQLKARGRWVDIDTPVGRVPSLLPPGCSRRI